MNTVSAGAMLAVAVGGAAGAVARYLISGWVGSMLGTAYPWGTQVVNVLGSFLFGLGYVLVMELGIARDTLRLVLLVGGVGAFTTFSTFSFETVSLLQMGEMRLALANVVVSVITCIIAVMLGLHLGRLFV